jgi:hypothetical protein
MSNIFKIKHHGQKLKVRLMDAGERIDAKSLACHKERLAYNHSDDWSEPPVVDYSRTQWRPSRHVGAPVSEFPDWVYIHVESAFYAGESVADSGDIEWR